MWSSGVEGVILKLSAYDICEVRARMKKSKQRVST